MNTRYALLGVALGAAMLLPAMTASAETTAPAAAETATDNGGKDAATLEKKRTERRAMMETRAKASFDEADANKDGGLDMEEFLARHRKKFVEIDGDKDGKLTPDEMKTYGAEMYGKMRERRPGGPMARDGADSKPEAPAAE